MTTLPILQEPDLSERLMQISHVVAESTDWKHALDEILPLLRPALIIDNLAIFEERGTPPALEAIFARAMGRGKSLEADIAWGENIATQVFNRRTNVTEMPEIQPATEQRNEHPYMLGLPLLQGEKSLGALVLIRFGGPVFTRKDERLASFLVSQIMLLLQRQIMQHDVDLLEVLRRQAYLQDSFVSMISHELRHPLGFIKGYVTTLMREDITWDAKTQGEFMTIIDQETDQLLEIIDNMLDSARLQSGHMTLEFQPVRLDALLNGVITLAKTHHPDLNIHLDVPAGLRPISGDPHRLGQVFNNLISNAHKYAPGSDIWITIKQEESGLLVEVRDQGLGIPPAFLPHIFERFFRNPEQSPNVHGSGLGLYICKQIVEAHCGEISAESPPGEGVTISVFLHFETPGG
jgi:signal transduction histidine kinase